MWRTDKQRKSECDLLWFKKIDVPLQSSQKHIHHKDFPQFHLFIQRKKLKIFFAWEK